MSSQEPANDCPLRYPVLSTRKLRKDKRVYLFKREMYPVEHLFLHTRCNTHHFQFPPIRLMFSIPFHARYLPLFEIIAIRKNVLW